MKYIAFYFKWIIYWMLTHGERNKYDFGMLKGMKVVSIKHDAFGSTIEYDPYQKPVKNFHTFREYKLLYHPDHLNFVFNRDEAFFLMEYKYKVQSTLRLGTSCWFSKYEIDLHDSSSIMAHGLYQNESKKMFTADDLKFSRVLTPGNVFDPNSKWTIYKGKIHE